MSQVDKLQDAAEQVGQLREEAARAQREARDEQLRREPLADTAAKAHTAITVALSQVRTMVNMRTGALPDLEELAVSIKETGLLHPPLVRATGEDDQPYELLAGRRRFSAMQLLDEVDGAREDWRFTLVDDISRREALTMQFAENFHQSKPEPAQFARAARAIMSEDPHLTAADVSRLVGAPLSWTRKALRLLDLPTSIVERVEEGDLSFTVADLVRRGIARGDVSTDEAADLVEQHAEGKITGGALKLGVGYVPPKPKDYDEQSRKLDEARWSAARDSDRSRDDAEQRDWESRGDRDNRAGGERAGRVPADVAPRVSAPGRGGPAAHVEPEDLDAYVLSLLLCRVIGDRSPDSAQGYAFSLRPEERLGVLRTLAGQLLADDPQPPRALQAAIAS